MTVANIGGGTRYRKHQVGTQTVLLTPVAATRALPYKGTLDTNPNRTDPDADVGSVDPILTPVLGALDITGTWDGAKLLAYNNLPLMWSYGCKGGVTPTGAVAKLWTYQVASLTADVFDPFTDEWGDDQNASDGIQAYGGVIDSWSMGFADDLSVWDTSASLIFAGANLATAQTGALTADANPTWVMGGQSIVSVDTVSGSFGITPWINTIHGCQVNWNNNLDRKRFANGSNNQRLLGGYGRGQRSIEIVITTAKTAQTMTERATIDDTSVANRYIQIKSTSDTIITGATPYSTQLRYPARLFSVTDGEIGNNATLIFTYHAFYDAALGYVANQQVTNTLAALP